MNGPMGEPATGIAAGVPGRLSFDEFLTLRSSDRRVARLTHDIPLPVARGLEVGPGGDPLPLPDGFRVEYVAHETDPTRGHGGGVAIDHVWAGAGSLAERCGRRAHYDFAIAAQVAQYVPNLLGWFKGLHEVLRVGGVLNVSLPDKRFMFDVHRHTSTIGEAVEAYHQDLARPSLRQLFDHTFFAADVDPARIWSEPGVAARVGRLSGEHALALADEQCREVLASGRYITCHCWVFTPLTFLDLLEAASRLGLFPFVMNQVSVTEPGGFEFFASFRRDAETRTDALLATQLSAIGHLRGIVERHLQRARLLGEPG